jgi:hypothetical protein
MHEIEESLRRAEREHAAARQRADHESASLIARAIAALQHAIDGAMPSADGPVG